MAGHLIDLKALAAKIDLIALANVFRRREIHFFSVDVLYEIAVEILHPRLIYQHRELENDLIVHRPVSLIEARIVEPVIAQHMVDVPVRINDRDRKIGVVTYELFKIRKAVCGIDQAGLVLAGHKIDRRVALLVKLIDALGYLFDKIYSVFCF